MVKKKVSNKGMNKNLVIGIVVVLLLIGVFLYFNNQKEVGLSPGIPPMDGPGDGGDGAGETKFGEKTSAYCWCECISAHWSSLYPGKLNAGQLCPKNPGDGKSCADWDFEIEPEKFGFNAGECKKLESLDPLIGCKGFVKGEVIPDTGGGTQWWEATDGSLKNCIPVAIV